MSKYLVVLFASAIMISCGSTDNSEKYTLSLNLETGHVYKQNLVSKVDMTQEAMGQSMDVKMTIEAEMSFNVKDFKDDQYEVEVSYDRMEMGIDAGNGNIAFGSALDSTNNALGQVMKSLTNKSFTMMITKSGKVTEVRDLANIFNEIFDSMPNVTEMQKEQMKSQLEESYGEGAIKRNLEQSFDFLPKEPVALGESWEFESKIEGQFPVNVKGSYTLEEVKDGAYIISNESEIFMNSDEPISQNGMELKMEITGDMTSTMTIDRKTSWIVTSTIDQTFGGTVSVASSPLMPDGMEMPIQISNKMTITSD
jgi:hypothetical protein